MSDIWLGDSGTMVARKTLIRPRMRELGIAR